MKNQNHIDELDGYCEMGMAKEALALSRKLLRRKNINAPTFAAVLTTLLIQADQLKRWRRAIEAAFEKLPLNGRANVTDKLFHFYVSVRDWNSAFSFLPKKPETCADLLFTMWTLLELRKNNEAKNIFRRCQRALRPPLDELDLSSLGEAMASYLVQTGNWEAAARIWNQNAQLETFAPDAWEGLIKLHAYRGLLQANEAFDAIKHEKFWDSSTEVTLPGNSKQIRTLLDKKFHRYAMHLAKVVPANERWKFGR
jgi:tetratricopeptide (TPR) repeat protein